MEDFNKVVLGFICEAERICPYLLLGLIRYSVLKYALCYLKNHLLHFVSAPSRLRQIVQHPRFGHSAYFDHHSIVPDFVFIDSAIRHCIVQAKKPCVLKYTMNVSTSMPQPNIVTRPMVAQNDDNEQESVAVSVAVSDSVRG